VPGGGDEGSGAGLVAMRLSRGLRGPAPS